MRCSFVGPRELAPSPCQLQPDGSPALRQLGLVATLWAVAAAGCAESGVTELVVASNGPRRELTVAGGVLRTLSISNPVTGARLQTTDDSEEFALVLDGDERLSSRSFTMVHKQAGRPRDDGSFGEAVIHLTHPDGWAVRVHYWADEAGNELHKQLSITAPVQASARRLMTVEVERLRLAGNVVEQPKLPRQITNERKATPIFRYIGALGLGQPLYLDGWIFTGLEYPGSANQIQGDQLTLAHFPGRRGDAIPAAGLDSKVAVWGVSEADGAPAAFRRYLRRRMLPGHRMRHFIDAFHLRGRANIGVGINKVPTAAELAQLIQQRPVLAQLIRTEDNAVRYARQTSRFARSHGIALDAFTVDGGWQDPSTVFEVDALMLPHGFEPLRRAAGLPLGLWNSLAGFRLDLEQLSQQHGYAICPPYSVSFDLSQPSYLEAITKRFVQLGAQEQVAYWKQDFNFLVCPLQTPLHPAEEPQSMEANLDALLSVIDRERELNPDVFINQTTLTWPSPWWLLHVHTTFGGDADYGYLQQLPAFHPRDWHATFVDAALFRRLRLDQAQYPSSRLMTHGMIQDRYVQLGGSNEPLASWANGMVAHLAPGMLLQELYLDPELLPPAHAQFLAGLLRWADAERALLFHYGEMVGGNPQEGLAYGFLHGASDQLLLFARNPSHEPRSLTVELPVAAATGPLAQVTLFPRIERHGLAAGQHAVELALAPHEVRVVRLLPTAEVPGWLESGQVYGAVPDGRGSLALHRVVQQPTPPQASVGRRGDGAFLVTLPPATEGTVELILRGEGTPQLTLELDGSPVPASSQSWSHGPCGPVGCPLKAMEGFQLVRVPLGEGRHLLRVTPGEGHRLHAIWCLTQARAQVEPVSGPPAMPLLPTPLYDTQQRWQLVQFELQVEQVDPMPVPAAVTGELQLEQLEVQVPLGGGFSFALDVQKTAGAPVSIPITLDPVAGTVVIEGSQASLGDQGTPGTIELQDVEALGTVRLTMSDYQGSFDGATGSMSIPLVLAMQVPAFKLELDLDLVAVTGVSSASNKGLTASSTGQVWAKDGTIRLAGTTVVPQGVPLLGELPAAILLDGRISTK